MKLFPIEVIIELLQQLNEKLADELEGQHLDFKEWNFKSLNDSVDEVIETAVCISNGGRGTVALGVKDRIVGLDNAITGPLWMWTYSNSSPQFMAVPILTCPLILSLLNIMASLRKEGQAECKGHGRSVKWYKV